VTWWGGYGIGANDWQDADVVLLFENFHLPNRTVIAMTQGLLGREATKPPLVDMVDTLCKSDTVEKIKTGHLLRWLKQLALRGKARQSGVRNFSCLASSGPCVPLGLHRPPFGNMGARGLVGFVGLPRLP
jgi:hypothetical protein